MSIKYNFSLFAIFVIVIHQNVYCEDDICYPCQQATLEYCCNYEKKCCDVHPVKGPGKEVLPLCRFTQLEETSSNICTGRKRCTRIQECGKDEICCFFRFCGLVCERINLK